MNDDPVIVIGAGRSGTNLLRDIICAFDGFSTWPCDEINYIWRHGNRAAPTDEFDADDARPDVVRYIRRQFDRQRRRQGGGVVVEKTCANSLRVAFVDAVIPEARFVAISRDGHDVVASAMVRWGAGLDIGYIARKARFVPLSDLPYYAWGYFRNRVHRWKGPDQRLATWGPRFHAPDTVFDDSDLTDVCAQQWARCRELMDRDLSQLPDERVHRIRYESLVTEPATEIGRLAAFLGVAAPPMENVPRVNANSVGKWRSLGTVEQAAVARAIERTSMA